MDALPKRESLGEQLPVDQSSANILVVDDDRKFLLAMEALLSGPDRVIFKAASGYEALRYVLKQSFALILLDIRMPEMDGFETASLIRTRNQSKDTPIIFISGVDTLESDVAKGFSQGGFDYIFKPIIPHVLKSKVAVFVEDFYQCERMKQQALQQVLKEIKR
jgi:CheY-like chemotaxis protein